MKKRKMLISVVVLAIACMGLAGCGDCDHDYGNWTTIKEATCTKDGEKERVCSECGNSETEKIEASGHDYVNGVCTECGNPE